MTIITKLYLTNLLMLVTLIAYSAIKYKKTKHPTWLVTIGGTWILLTAVVTTPFLFYLIWK